VHKQLQTMSAATRTSLDDGIMGTTPTSTSMASVAMSLVPSPIPSDQLMHHPRVNFNNQPPRTQIPEGIHIDEDRVVADVVGYQRCSFPHFDGTDPHIWLDTCSLYFALYKIHPSFLSFSGLVAHVRHCSTLVPDIHVVTRVSALGWVCVGCGS
jgi:hypothetical protein